jgi:hypothetical protein
VRSARQGIPVIFPSGQFSDRPDFRQFVLSDIYRYCYRSRRSRHWSHQGLSRYISGKCSGYNIRGFSSCTFYPSICPVSSSCQSVFLVEVHGGDQCWRRDRSLKLCKRRSRYRMTPQINSKVVNRLHVIGFLYCSIDVSRLAVTVLKFLTISQTLK